MTSSEPRWIDAGLLDPDDPAADDRRALLTFLESIGVTIDEMLVSKEGRSLEASAPDHILRVESTRSIDDVAARTGLHPDTVRRVILAAGFAVVPEADVPSLSEDEASMVGALAAAMELMGDEAILAFTRVIGSSLARVAEAADAMFLTEIEAPLRGSGGTQLDLARSSYEGAQLLLGVPDLMGLMFLRHVTGAINRSRAARAPATSDRYRLAVGFGDIVGSTQLATDLSPRALHVALARFEQEAAERAAAVGARLVKSMGDAVMVVGADPVAVADVLAALCVAVHDDPVLTELRAAVAVGDLVGREGDWFGPDVNLAARAVHEAEPGTVVVTEAVAAAFVAAGRACDALGDFDLRGIREPVPLFRAFRPPEADR